MADRTRPRSRPDSGGRKSAMATAGGAVISTQYLSEVRSRLTNSLPFQMDVTQHGVAPLTTKDPTPRRRNSQKSGSARRQRMQQFDTTRHLEKSRRPATIENDEEMIKFEIENRNNPALAAARERVTEETDEIKAVKQKLNLARDLKIREQQIALKRRQKEGERSFHIGQDMRAEQDRQAELEIRELEARKKREQQQAYTAELKAQIDRREIERDLEKEAKHLEGQQMLEEMRERERQAVREAKARELEAQRRRADAELQNQQALIIKQRRAEQEARLDQEALRYVKEKEREMQERYEFEQREKIRKEKEIAILRAQQEKIIDNRSAEDEARARKHQEARILQERARQREEDRARQALLQECHQSRLQQTSIKQQRKAIEQDVDANLMRMQQQALDEQSRLRDERAEEERRARKYNQAVVLRQVDAKRRQAEAERLQKYKEREEMLNAEARRKHLIAKVEKRLVGEVEAEGVEPDYMRRTHVQV